MSVHYSKKAISTYLEAYGESGQTQKAFCLERGLKTPTFSRWLRQSRKQDSVKGFVELKGRTVKKSPYVLRFVDGKSLELPGTLPLKDLSVLLKSLGC